MAGVEIAAGRLDERRIAERGAVEAALLAADIRQSVREVDVAKVRANFLRDVRADGEHTTLSDRAQIRDDVHHTTEAAVESRRVGDTAPLAGTMLDGPTKIGRPSDEPKGDRIEVVVERPG
jgi:hypothetical protein